MSNQRTNKETITMTAKKMLTVLAAMLMLVLPLQGVSAANANGVTTTLSTFEINGSPVEDQDILIVPNGTTAVTVVATPTDLGASAVVTGDTGLVTGSNDVLVTVTSSNTLVEQVYTVTVFVTTQGPGFSSDTTLASLSVNGTVITPGQTIEVAPLTSAVTVEAVTSDVNATSSVSGAINLVTGLNTVTVTVTAEDGVSVHDYTFKVRVLALSSDVALDTFTVNGQAVRNGGRLYLEPGTESVSVVATPSDPSSSVGVTGATGLIAGANTLSVLVTAEDGSTATYSVTLNVQVPSSISSLVVFKVSGARVSDGGTVILPSGTAAVAVTAIPSDATASVSVTGSNALALGENTLTVVVTAEDGSATTYSVTLVVLANDDTSLALFQYDGADVADGDVFDLENSVESVEVVAETTSSLSTVEITGADALVPGKNVVRVTVTAEDGSVTTYRLIFNRAAGSDTSVESITVAGQDATAGAVTLPAGSRAASVVVVTTDPLASYVVDGNLELFAGENAVTVTVTAADGSTTEDVAVTVTVEEVILSDDTSVESITVAGQDGLGGTVNVGLGTIGVVVSVVTTDPFASFTVDGNVDLAPGENTVTITVTAADGETTEDYTVLVVIPELSDDASYVLFEINGAEVNDGDQVTLVAGSTRVNTKVELTDAGATYGIVGDGKIEPLVVGDNELVLTITAANGDSVDYTVTLTVPAPSDNVNLDGEAGLIIDGEVADLALLEAEGGYYSVPLGISRISIGVKAEDAGADVFVADKTVLPGVARLFSLEAGVNSIPIEVIPAAGEDFAKTYILKVYVGGLDASLKSVKVNNTAITFDESNSGTFGTTLANGTSVATLFVDPSVAQAVGGGAGTIIEFDGGEATVEPSNTAKTYNITGLVTGENLITINVTPGDAVNGESLSYTVIINVALSSDKRLKTFLLNGASVVVGSTQILAKGTTSVELDGEAVSELASYEVSGGDELVNGLNTLLITVTAEDGSTAEYKVTAIVPKAVDTILVGFPKVGVITVDAKTNKAGNLVLANQIKKIGKGTVFKVEITNNFLIAKDKPTAGPARALAVQNFLKAAKVLGVKTATYTLAAGAKTLKGTQVKIYYY